MIDGIIKGTGNSRKLKSVSNFLSLYPTYADFAAALIAGTLPIDLAGINADGWQQLATALSKGNLFSDATAEKFVSNPQTVDAALANLADYKINYLPINALSADDLNNATYQASYETGIVAADAISIGLPSGYYVFKYLRWGGNDGNGVQTASLNGTNTMWYRGSSGTTWNQWVPVGNTRSGSYSGTGTYGSANPVNIPVGFIPKLFIVYSANKMAIVTPLDSQAGIYIKDTSVYTFGTPGLYFTLANTTSFYSSVSSEGQFNSSGVAAFWVAIG